MARELELKYRAGAAQMERILADYPAEESVCMETTYFDTPEKLLKRQHRTLRCRLENGVAVYTMKTPLPDGSRAEWETEAGSLAEALVCLCRMGAPELPEADTLTPLCGARFTRLRTMVPTADGTAELALDEGILLGGGKEIPLREVELELKAGSDGALLELGRKFAGEYALEVEPKSKFARASALG